MNAAGLKLTGRFRWSLAASCAGAAMVGGANWAAAQGGGGQPVCRPDTCGTD